LCDVPARSFQELYVRARAAGVGAGIAFSMTLITQQTDPTCVKVEELRWAVYVFAPELQVDEVMAMSRAALYEEYDE
jgi:hypothetical protein